MSLAAEIHRQNHLGIDNEDGENEESESDLNNSTTVETSVQKKCLVDYSFSSDEENEEQPE